MELQTGNSNSNNFITKAFEIIPAMVLVAFFGFVGAWFPLGALFSFVIALYYLITGFLVTLISPRWWVPPLIAIPIMAEGLIIGSTEPITLLAYVVIPLSMTLLGGGIGIYIRKKSYTPG